MSWITPKTDWTGNDAVSYSNYNRIKNNLNYLKELANELYLPFSIEDMGADKNKTSHYYASEFNAFENNLTTINDSIYSLEIGTEKTFVDGGKFIDYTELNRIESACLNIYKLLTKQKESISTLPFVCGSAIGGEF